MIHLARILLLLLVTVIAQAQVEGGAVEVNILHTENEKGQLLNGLYDSEASWFKKPAKGVFGKIIDGQSEAIFTKIPDGTYAISVYHDADNDGKPGTIFGIPTEDTGSSNDASARFGPPKWEDAKFEVKGRALKQIINL